MSAPDLGELRTMVLADLDACPFNEDVNDASMCMCGLPALNHDTIVEQVVFGDHPHIAALLDDLEAARDTERAATITNTKAALDYLDTMRAEIETLTAQRDRAERRRERLVSGVEAFLDDDYREAQNFVRIETGHAPTIKAMALAHNRLRALLAESAASEEGA